MKRRPKLPFLSKKSGNQASSKTSIRKGPKNIEDLPFEVLCKIFKFLSPSDILRCSRTCRVWLEASNEVEVWKNQFRRLPKRIQNLSLEAKKPKSDVNWKREAIICLKKARKKQLDGMLKKISSYTGFPEKSSACIRCLEVRWSLVFTDLHGSLHEVTSKDINHFSTSISVCWNEVDLPPIGELRTCAVYADSPLFCHKDGSVVQDRDFAKSTVFLGKDQFISIYYQPFGIAFGVWHDKSIKMCSIAFITLYMSMKNIIDRIIGGTSERSYLLPPHVTIVDDLDGKYGLQRYSAFIELRTNRKSLWNFQVMEFYKAQVDKDLLVMTDERPTHRGSFDIQKSIRLPWKSGSIKGVVKNMAVIDFTLIDGNKEFIWCVSQPVQAAALAEKQVEFDEDGSEKLLILVEDADKGTFALHVSCDTDSDSCAVRAIEVRLKLSFIDQWFGTSYITCKA